MIALSLSMSVFLQLSLAGTTYALQCYNCSNIADAGECLTLEECRAGQSCYMGVKASGQTSTLGCTDNKQCGVTGVGNPVGKDLSARQSSDCHECCNTEKCNKDLCVYVKHGGWSDWGQWATCPVTCGGGIQTRSRACTNPRPSPLGKYCEGDPMEVVLCNKVTCSPNIVFKAKNVTDKSPKPGQTMIFGSTLVNEGNAYNTSSGIFTAPVNGTYSFSTQFCASDQSGLDIAIIVDEATYAITHLYDDVSSCNTADTVAMLHAQSKVWVKCTHVDGFGTIISESYMNSFSGYLVHQ